ncbi:sensor histidine kinase [Dendrosporobacter sp. 1207_IL3150]|uniref:sensor histidine kinase n=1 Tax=Dendrosporobacter sp. 1207_IL3150 TaxID=3084054 RepID=UPI002FDA8CEC
MIRSIFSKLMLSQLIVILVCTLTLGLFMSYFIKEHVINTKREELVSKGLTIISLLESSGQGGRTLGPALPQIGELAGATIWLADKNGTLVDGSPPPRWRRPFPEQREEIGALFEGTPQTWTRTGRKQIDPSLVVALPLTNTPIPTALFLYTPIVGITKTVDSIEQILTYSILLGIFIAVTLGLGISRSITRPISNMSRTAKLFAMGEYSARTTATGSDEVGALGKTLNTMAESLANAERNRREFLANVTHELKTPVTSIQALAEIILDGLAVQPDQQRRYLTTIVTESQRITRLIDDLLDLAQLESGKVSIKYTSVSLIDILTFEKDKFSPQLLEKNLELKFNLPLQLPLISTDSDRLQQVLSNLISNAIRHSPENSAITIAVEIHKDKILIAVIDMGNGIPLKDIPHIWERFYCVDKSRARSSGGTGLGLAITQKLVHTLGGEINVLSKAGSGTTFSFSLPLKPEEKKG